MSPEHHNLVSLVRARNFRDDVVRRPTFGMDPVDDVELELDYASIGQQPPDATVVLVAHDQGGRRLCQIERRLLGNAGASERTDLPVVAAGVVDANERAVSDQKLVELLLDLVVRQRLRLPVALWLLLWLLLWRPLRRWLTQLRQHVSVFAA